jgi:hypothetical protein
MPDKNLAVKTAVRRPNPAACWGPVESVNHIWTRKEFDRLTDVEGATRYRNTYAEINVIKEGMSVMRHDIRGMQHDIRGMRHDIRGMRHDIRGMRHDIRGVRADISKMARNFDVKLDALLSLLQRRN